MKGVVDGYTWDQKIRITQKTLRRWQEPAYRLSALQRRKLQENQNKKARREQYSVYRNLES